MAYYLWYGTPQHDGAYRHWDHKILPHWDESIRSQYLFDVPHQPPHDIHSPYYPARGLYSSRDPSLLRDHLATMKREAEAGVVVVSWWGRPDVEGTADTQGVNTDAAVSLVLRAAEETGMEVAFHLEPYPGRSAASVAADIEYLLAAHGNSPALHRRPRAAGGPALPVMYVYDSYHVSPGAWAEVLCAGGASSVRGREGADAFMVGLWLEADGGRQLVDGCFDGFYTYFASDGFTYGSSTSNWASMVRFASQHGLLPVLSVGPGYNDTKIRPWNAANTRPRADGTYYDRMWGAALAGGAAVVQVTSFNEWGEGTQVEEATPRPGYSDYGRLGPGGYLARTATWSSRLAEGRQRDEL